MSFQIGLDDYELIYAHFSRQVREAIQKTFDQEAANGLSQKEIAENLGVDESLVSRRLNGPGNITLRTLSDLYVAMGREPLSNFVVPSAVYIVSASTSTNAQSPFIPDGTVRPVSIVGSNGGMLAYG